MNQTKIDLLKKVINARLTKDELKLVITKAESLLQKRK